MIRSAAMLLMAALVLNGAFAQTPTPDVSDNWNARDLAQGYLAIDVLARCHAASTGDVSSDELNNYRGVLKRIEEDALKRNPRLDRGRVSASGRPAQVGSVVAMPWLCAAARVNLSASLWSRFIANDYSDDGTPVPRSNRLAETLRNANCRKDDSCVLSLLPTLERQGLVLNGGPYCRAHQQECDELQRAMDANIPVTRCDFAVDVKKCDEEIAKQQERFRKARQRNKTK